MWYKSLTLEKFISFRMKWFFSPPFLSVSPFLLLNLARRQCYAYAIGLFTRLEIKSWPDVKFCAHAQCVLPRCWSGASPGVIGSVIPGLYHELWRHRETHAENAKPILPDQIWLPFCQVTATSAESCWKSVTWTGRVSMCMPQRKFIG